MQKFREQLDFNYRLGLTATESAKSIHSVYGEDSITFAIGWRYYRLLKSGQEYTGPKPRSGRPRFAFGDGLHDLVDADPYFTTRKSARAFGCGNWTVWRHLRQMGLTKKWNIWVPHQLSPKHEEHRYQVALNILYRQIAKPFLANVVTGDKKWVLCCNKGKKRGWSYPGEPFCEAETGPLREEVPALRLVGYPWNHLLRAAPEW